MNNMGIFNDVINGKMITKEYGPIVMKEIAPQIECVDGTKLSVQASSHHYSIPRSNTGIYTHVEVGFPSVEPPESWAEYFDGDWESGDRTGSVYGYIPIELVKEYIDAHGGEGE